MRKVFRHYFYTLLKQGGQNLQPLPVTYKVHGHKSIGIILIFFAVVFGPESGYEVLRALGNPALSV